jgi:predicted transcriptional regulator
MFAKNLIDKTIEPAKLSDNCLQALTWMDDNKIGHLPVVEDQAYFGTIAEETIYNLEEPDVKLDTIKNRFTNKSILDNTLYPEVLEAFIQSGLTLLPVLDAKTNYIGVITPRMLVKAFANVQHLDHPGATIVLEVNENDFLLSQISQIAEANDIKILSLDTLFHHDSTLMDIVLKVNKEEVESLLKTFERYQYKIKNTLSKKELEWEKLRNNYQYIMNYLNI